MAFLDNSGDIILDAVLTDAGRQRLSRGNFKITKFAFGDEEINYNVFNGSHPSGSAFYDLDIMQTPILEAFTNNTSLMKSKLITMTRNNILYMPIFKLNNRAGTRTETTANLAGQTAGDTSLDDALNFGQGYVLLADRNTERNGTNNDFALKSGLLRGAMTAAHFSGDKTNHIAVDQGIDSSEGGLSFRQAMPADLVETAFLIKMDHRLINLAQIAGAANERVAGMITNQFIDDDGIATYYVVQGDGTSCVEGPPVLGRNNPFINDNRSRGGILNDNPDVADGADTFADKNERFPGPLGSILRFLLRTSMHVRQSDALFDEFGTASTNLVRIDNAGLQSFNAWKYIDTLVNIVGVTTGYSIDIPIRIVKKS